MVAWRSLGKPGLKMPLMSINRLVMLLLLVRVPDAMRLVSW